MTPLSLHNGLIWSGIRPIDPKNAPQGVCVFASVKQSGPLTWWRFNWSDLLALADKLPFDQVRA